METVIEVFKAPEKKGHIEIVWFGNEITENINTIPDCDYIIEMLESAIKMTKEIKEALKNER